METFISIIIIKSTAWLNRRMLRYKQHCFKSHKSITIGAYLRNNNSWHIYSVIAYTVKFFTTQKVASQTFSVFKLEANLKAYVIIIPTLVREITAQRGAAHFPKATVLSLDWKELSEFIPLRTQVN